MVLASSFTFMCNVIKHSSRTSFFVEVQAANLLIRYCLFNQLLHGAASTFDMKNADMNILVGTHN